MLWPILLASLGALVTFPGFILNRRRLRKEMGHAEQLEDAAKHRSGDSNIMGQANVSASGVSAFRASRQPSHEDRIAALESAIEAKRLQREASLMASEQGLGERLDSRIWATRNNLMRQIDYMQHNVHQRDSDLERRRYALALIGGVGIVTAAGSLWAILASA